jgi:Mn-dependent DtxR family transcriptional regulator
MNIFVFSNLTLSGRHMSRRMEILNYIKKTKYPSFAQMTRDLNLHTDTLAFELKILKEKGCIIVFSGGFYSLTQEGERELKQLKGEKP